MSIQLAVQDTDGVRTALSNGIDRVELSCALDLGGLTPSLGAVEQAVAVGVPVYVLVRPRPGDFCYNLDEVSQMMRDVELVLDAGATGVSIGALTEDQHLSMLALKPIADLVRARMGVELSLNRCVDQALRAGVSPAEITSQATELGCTRFNSSGGAPNAMSGVECLQTLQELWADSGIVQAVGGIRVWDLPVFAEHGVAAVQLSARAWTESQGGVCREDNFTQRSFTDPAEVAHAVDITRG